MHAYFCYVLYVVNTLFSCLLFHLFIIFLCSSVIGCADPKPPRGSQMFRNEGTVSFTCADNDIRWQMHCRGNHWVGEMGRCVDGEHCKH